MNIPVETEEEKPQSVFAVALKHTPPCASGTRGLLQVLDHFLPDQLPDESLRQVDGTLIGGAEARTCLKILSLLLGPIHPAVMDAAHDLREELRK